jgi:hypothetical protein
MALPPHPTKEKTIMGRAKDKLTARQVASLKAPAMHSDGDGLYLAII